MLESKEELNNLFKSAVVCGDLEYEVQQIPQGFEMHVIETERNVQIEGVEETFTSGVMVAQLILHSDGQVQQISLPFRTITKANRGTAKQYLAIVDTYIAPTLLQALCIESMLVLENRQELGTSTEVEVS